MQVVTIDEVESADLRLDYHVSENSAEPHVSLEVTHRLDYEDGDGNGRMDIERVLFLDFGGKCTLAEVDAASDLAAALCDTVNQSPELLGKFKAYVAAKYEAIRQTTCGS